MFTAILWSILNGISNIFLKKSIQLNKWSELFYMSFSQLQFFIIAIVGYILWFLNYNFWDNNLRIYGLIILTILFWTIYAFALQYWIKNEKITVLQPYANLDKIVTIILGYFLFTWASLTTFFVAILAFVIIILFSIDFKSFKISKTIIIFAVWNIFWAFRMLLAWYILLSMDSLNFVLLYAWILFPLFIIGLYVNWEIIGFKENDVKFYWYRMWASISWWAWYFISIFLLSELGVVLSSLLSLVSLITTMLFAFIILKDKPRFKDIFLSALIVILIWIWYYFN
jgi:hypothetical protein